MSVERVPPSFDGAAHHVLGTAMCLAVPNTWLTGMPEVVPDGRAGFLVEEKDADALADKLSKLIGHPDCWKEMGKIGGQHVLAGFDINRLKDRLVAIYKETINAG